MATCGTVCSRGGSRVGLALLLTALFGSGCAPKTYPVQGKVVFDKGDIKLLEGGTLYCQQEQDPQIHAQGDVNADGSFTLGTYWRGKPLPGAFEGKYRAWYLLPTEGGSEESQFRKIQVDPRFLDGKASPLTVTVPATGEVVLTLTKAKPGAKLPSTQPPPGRSCDELGVLHY
jgi:hypothetical protein